MYDCLTRYFTAKTRGQNESDLNLEWRLVTETFGRATRAALLSTLVTNVTVKATQPRKPSGGGRLGRMAVFCPPVGREPLDAPPVWADPPAHRATHVASDLIERTAH